MTQSPISAVSMTFSQVLIPPHPRLGERVERYLPREVRRLIIGRYEMRYEIAGTLIRIVRLWHAREDR